MPGGDGTGPLGFGTMTGRRAGFCAGFNMPGFTNSIGGRGFFGRGRGIGYGRGRGHRNRFFATGLPFWARNSYPTTVPFSKEEEMNMLKNEAKFMQDEMAAINERIQELEKEKQMDK
jgi:hypothetical protein